MPCASHHRSSLTPRSGVGSAMPGAQKCVAPLHGRGWVHGWVGGWVACWGSNRVTRATHVLAPLAPRAGAAPPAPLHARARAAPPPHPPT